MRVGAKPAPVVRGEGTQIAAEMADPEEGDPGAGGGSSLASGLADVAGASAAAVEGASAGIPSSEPAFSAGGVRGGVPEGHVASPSTAPIGAHRAPPTQPTRGPPSVILLSAKDLYRSVYDTAAATADDAPIRSPRQLPVSGAPPSPASGGASGGSAPSSGGGAGQDLSGALALVLGAALAGRFLWHARDLLRPDPVVGPIVNEPS